MKNGIQSSKKLGSLASEKLRDKNSSKTTKQLSGSTLSNRNSGSKSKTK